MAQDGIPRWFWPDQRFGLRIADDGTVELISLDGVVALSILPDGTLEGALLRAESFADPVAAQDLATKHYVDTHGGGGAISVTDGSTTVAPTTELDFTSGATVSDLGGGVAGVAVSGGGGAVDSVFGRTGDVVAETGDYTAAEVGALASTDTLHDIAAANANDGDVALNAHKITALADGAASTDAAAFGQIPTSLPPSGSAGGDLTGSYPNPSLAAAGGGAAGPIGSATVTPIVTVDAKGRVTALSSATTVPTNAAGGDLTGNFPNPTLANEGPGAVGPIGDATHVAAVSTDAKGRVSALSSVGITFPVSSVFTRTGAVTAQSGDYTDAEVTGSPTNVLTATGDLLYASAANTLARLGVSVNGDVLTLVAGLPQWQAATVPSLGFALVGLG